VSEEGGGPSGGDALIGCFAIVFGACILLLGGACTVSWVVLMIQSARYPSQHGIDSSAIVVLVLSVALVGGGLLCIRFGTRIAGGYYRRPAPPPSEGAAGESGDV